MLQITKKADYAVRLMLEVASHPGNAVTTTEIARKQGIPYQFLRKVAQTLVSRGLLIGERGGRGGLRLARPPEDISVLDVLKALDVPPLNDCSMDPDNCPRRHACAAFPVWYEAQLELDRVLGAATLARLARANRALQARNNASQTGQMAHARDPESPIPSSQMARQHRRESQLQSVMEPPIAEEA